MRVGEDVDEEIKKRWEREKQGGEWGEINQEMDGEGSTRSKWWRGEKRAARRSCLVGSSLGKENKYGSSRRSLAEKVALSLGVFHSGFLRGTRPSLGPLPRHVVG